MRTTSIRQMVVVPAEPMEVYGAYMDARRHEAFTGCPATSTPRVGGRMTAWDGYITARNLELEKGRRIVQEWSTTDWPDDCPPSRLEITLEARKHGTEISLAHTGVPVEQAEDYAQGWHDFYWEPMRKYFKEGRKKRAGG